MAKNDLSNLEIEAKFRVNGASVASQVLAPNQVTFGFSGGPVYIKTNVDTYYDTEDMALYCSGLALRVRRTVTSSLVTLKSIDAVRTDVIVQRFEMERYVNADASSAPYLDQLLDEMNELIVSKLPENAVLAPIMSLLQERSKRIVNSVTTKDDVITEELFAEMSLDNVWVLAKPDVESVVSANTEDAVYQFTELELELLAADNRAEFDRLVSLVSLSPLVTPSLTSKLEVGLRAIGRISD